MQQIIVIETEHQFRGSSVQSIDFVSPEKQQHYVVRHFVSPNSITIIASSARMEEKAISVRILKNYVVSLKLKTKTSSIRKWKTLSQSECKMRMATKFSKILTILGHFGLLSPDAPIFFSLRSHRMPLGSEVSALHPYPFHIEVPPPGRQSCL